MSKFNDTAISKLRWDQNKRTSGGKVPQFQFHNDPEVKGHHLRILPPDSSGRSSKIFWLKYGTERKVYRIGEFGEWSVSAARTEARRVRREFYSDGVDPNQARQQRLRKANARYTVKQLVASYIEEHEGEWAASYARANRLHGKRITDALGSRYADQVTREDVGKLFLHWKKHSPSQARLLQTFGKAMHEWSMDMTVKKLPVSPNPFVLARKSSSASSPYKVHLKERERHLESDKAECAALFSIAEDYPIHLSTDHTWAGLVRLFLLTGFRESELREARWEHLDHSTRTLRNVSPKGGTDFAYDMPLTDMGWTILEGLAEGHMKFRRGPILPSVRDADKSISEFRVWYEGISKDPRMPMSSTEERGPGHITIHDLRRSAVTWLEEMQFTTDERTVFKGSQPSGVTARTYSQTDKRHIRLVCAQGIESRILDVEGGKEREMFDSYRTERRTAGAI